MKLTTVGSWAAAALFFCGVALEAQAASCDCLLYPVYDDGVDTLWDADYYPDSTMCDNPPTEEYIWEPDSSNPSAPQVCANGCGDRGALQAADAVPRAAVAKVHQLKVKGVVNPVPVDHEFADTVRKVHIRSKISGIYWNAAKAVTESHAYWVKVKTEDETVLNVKLYVVNLDFGPKGAGLPGTEYKKQTKTIFVGFEIASVPAHHAASDKAIAGVVTAVKLKGKEKDSKYEGLVTIPNELHEFRIITAKPLFK